MAACTHTGAPPSFACSTQSLNYSSTVGKKKKKRQIFHLKAPDFPLLSKNFKNLAMVSLNLYQLDLSAAALLNEQSF